MGLRAEVTAQDMEDTFLPAFEAGVESAHAVGLMCSYSAPSFGGGLKDSNAADGSTTPSCANRELLTGLSTFSLYPCLAAEGRGLLVDSPLYPWVRRLNGVDGTSVLRDRFVPADWCARRDADANTR